MRGGKIFTLLYLGLEHLPIVTNKIYFRPFLSNVQRLPLMLVSKEGKYP